MFHKLGGSDEGDVSSSEETIEVQAVIEEPDNTPTTPEDWDTVLENALLQACKTSAKKVELPILSSSFYRTHILTSLPPGMDFDVKKTSFKKLSKFLDKMVSDGLLSVNEPKKGIEMVSQIHYDHPKIAQYRVQKYEEIQGTASSKEEKV
jgi:translation initiation factor 2D